MHERMMVLATSMIAFTSFLVGLVAVVYCCLLHQSDQGAGFN
jgi:hypothetical protein|tara:strand:+ start:205 stop:330 length:126 start_codon:yes stop_codon:yes gene_type:complete